MCENCWIEAGSPAIDNAKVRTAVRLINALYELHSAGGMGHVVFDDWNVELTKSCILDCYDADLECYDADATKNVDDDVVEMSRVALEYFELLTTDERYSALAQRDGFINICV